MSTSESNERARDQARLQYESIEQLITAYDLDWDRLEELRSERDDFVQERLSEIEIETKELALASWAVLHPDETEELADLERDAAGYEDQDAVEQAIRDDPLSVEVRSGWHSPGEEAEDDEFQILLCTGGPAVRIVGELGRHNCAERAWIEYQDWFTSWEKWNTANSDVLCRYANFFLGY
jgi:hypothetical protein